MEKILAVCFVFGILILFLLVFMGMNPTGTQDQFAASVAGGMLLFLVILGLSAMGSK